ncbi:MAG: FAD-binding oxidoreductase [Nanoarchaeota archaeon]
MVEFNTLTVSVVKIIGLTHDAKAYLLAISQSFGYRAGQFVTLTVSIPQIDGTTKMIKRSYSLASSPLTQGSIELCIKETPGGVLTPWFLRNIKIGDHVVIQGPFGKFCLYDQDSPRTIYLISAGSGVAPVMGILRDCVARKRSVQIGWLSSNKTSEDIIYRKEIEEIAQGSTLIKVLFTITRETESLWNGHIGRINKDLLNTFCNDKKECIVFICGPPGFVDEVSKDLLELGIEPGQIRKEKYD